MLTTRTTAQETMIEARGTTAAASAAAMIRIAANRESFTSPRFYPRRNFDGNWAVIPLDRASAIMTMCFSISS